MDALILTGSTGGGHNGAAYAVKEELERRGYTTTLMDPYELASPELVTGMGDFYKTLVQKLPRLFGVIYTLGAGYDKLPLPSPVYLFNRKMPDIMNRYLEAHHYDIIVAVHLFASEILTYMKDKGMEVPPFIYVATDYTCIPFTRELKTVYDLIPCSELIGDFVHKGVEESKLLTFGIPIRSEFRTETPRETLIRELGLDPEQHYLLVMGGSIGAGKMHRVVAALEDYLDANKDCTLICICGSNEQLYEKLSARYGNYERIILMKLTDRVGDYMKISDVLITKPGGLSSTEAAVCGVPMIHVRPIAALETKNVKYFVEHGLSVCVRHLGHLDEVVDQLRRPDNSAEMVRLQKEVINPYAAAEFCDFIDEYLQEEERAAG